MRDVKTGMMHKSYRNYTVYEILFKHVHKLCFLLKLTLTHVLYSKQTIYSSRIRIQRPCSLFSYGIQSPLVNKSISLWMLPHATLIDLTAQLYNLQTFFFLLMPAVCHICVRHKTEVIHHTSMYNCRIKSSKNNFI